MPELLDPKMIGPVDDSIASFTGGGFLFRTAEGAFYSVSVSEMAELFGGGGGIPPAYGGEAEDTVVAADGGGEAEDAVTAVFGGGEAEDTVIN